MEKSSYPSAEEGFVFVSGGCFNMGDLSEKGDADALPVHEVCVDDFYLSDHEVTQEEWTKVMGNNPSYFYSCGKECPVEKVSWFEVQDYIKKVNKQRGTNYRLPTEAEWEYAARSGGKPERWAGTNDVSELIDYAWYVSNSARHPHPVKGKKPNHIGLYDMTGNVWEWVQDWYSEEYYNSKVRNNPTGPFQGTNRVIRGGGWPYQAREVRVFYRNDDSPEYRLSFVGFRLARSAGKF
ncbi:MAG: formylglycine-generating enzyme family protein [Nitrospinota bacterium]